MAQQNINIDTPNSGSGTPIRDSFDICNDNFTELYGEVATIPDLYVVADAAALLAVGSPKAGDVALQTDTDELFLYNGSAWDRRNNRYYAVADATALAALSDMRIGDAARRTDNGEIYLYDGSSWQSTGVGGGGGDATRINDADDNTYVDTDAVADTITAAAGGQTLLTAAATNMAMSVTPQTDFDSGFEAKTSLLGIAGINGGGMITHDTRSSGNAYSYFYAGESTIAGGDPQQSVMGILNNLTAALCEFGVAQSNTLGMILKSRVIRGAGEQLTLTAGPNLWDMQMVSGGQTGNLDITPSLFQWDREVKLDAFPNSRDDGATTKALYVDPDGDLQYGAIQATQIVDSDADSDAGFSADDVFLIDINGANTADYQFDGDYLTITSAEIEFGTNSSGVVFRSDDGTRVRLNVISDGSPLGHSLQLALA